MTWIERIKKLMGFPKQGNEGFWENLYCLGRGDHEILSLERITTTRDLLTLPEGVLTGDDILKKARKTISQAMAYYGKKHGKKYAVRKVPGGVKVWRIE
jgi:hypothetical protein